MNTPHRTVHNLQCFSSPPNDTQTDEQKALWQQILDIVNKTNLIDYTMDIRMRLQLGDKMPEVSILRRERMNEIVQTTDVQFSSLYCRNLPHARQKYWRL